MTESRWLLLITSLPGKSGSVRMRIWRALKAGGAGILRDGVYLLPAAHSASELFDAQAEQVRAAGGTAYVLELDPDGLGGGANLLSLFDRQSDYEGWAAAAAKFATSLPSLDEPLARREEANLRRHLDAIKNIDFFPGTAQARAGARLDALSAEINRMFSPGEPRPRAGVLERQLGDNFRGRTWATRQNLWVDRVASAWLIRRFIDPNAAFLWLRTTKACPPDAVGFDFDDATFTHVDDHVTFETLLFAFSLETDRALSRIGALVHYLDVGGTPVADAAGFVAMLSGVKQNAADDDAFLQDATALLNHLYTAYEKDVDTAARS